MRKLIMFLSCLLIAGIGISQPLNIVTAPNGLSRAIDTGWVRSISRNAGGDSLIFYKGGVRNAVKAGTSFTTNSAGLIGISLSGGNVLSGTLNTSGLIANPDAILRNDSAFALQGLTKFLADSIAATKQTWAVGSGSSQRSTVAGGVCIGCTLPSTQLEVGGTIKGTVLQMTSGAATGKTSVVASSTGAFSLQYPDTLVVAGSDFDGIGNAASPLKIDSANINSLITIWLTSRPGYGSGKVLGSDFTWVTASTGGGGTVTQQYLTLLNRSATVTESPAHTFTGVAYMLDDKYLPADSTGYIAMQWNNDNIQGTVMGLDAQNTLEDYFTTQANYDYGMYIYLVSGTPTILTTDLNAPSGTGSGTPVTDMWLGFFKTISGSNMTITLKMSTDGGTTYPTTVRAYSATPKTNLYIKYANQTSSPLKNPVGYNVQ